MAPPSSSLTSIDSLSKVSLDSAWRTPYDPRLVPPSVKLPAARLIDYSSSEDEPETNQAQVLDWGIATALKKPKPKRNKCAESVNSESDGPDIRTGVRQQQSHKQLFTSLKKLLPDLSSTALTKLGKMVRMDSYSWGASASQMSRDIKKRPLSPSEPPIAIKRYRAGPFIDDSDSGGEWDKDNGDGSSFDKHISTTPNFPVRSARSSIQSPSDEEGGIFHPRASLREQGLIAKFEHKPSPSSITTTSQFGKGLNKDRFSKLMAKKQGGFVEQGSTQQAPQTALRSRPTDGVQAGSLLQKKPPAITVAYHAFAEGEKYRPATQTGQLRTSQKIVHPPKPIDTPPSSLGSRSGPNPQVISLGASRRPAERSVEEVYKPSQALLSRLQKSTNGITSQAVPTQAHNKQTEILRTAYSSISRKANTARSYNRPNRSSLRNVLDMAKVRDLGAAKEQDNIGSEWYKARSERVLTSPARNLHRPEAGAIYGHTLTARNASAVEVPVNTNCTPALAAEKDRQTSKAQSFESTEERSTRKPSFSCNKKSTAHASGSNPAVRRDIPVAVMVRPERGLDAPFLPRNRTKDAQSVFAPKFDAQLGYTSNPDDITGNRQVSTGEHDARAQAALATTIRSFLTKDTTGEPDKSQYVDRTCIDKSRSAVSGERVPKTLSLPLHDVASEQRYSKSSEPIKTVSSQPGTTVPPKPVDSVHKERHLSESSSSKIPHSVLAPAKQLSPPFSTRVFPPEATALTLSPRSIMEPSLPQPCPVPNVDLDSEILAINLPASTIAARSSTLAPPVDITLSSPNILPNAEQYFEYSIHQALSSSLSANITTEISAQPLTSLDTAKVQLERSYQNSRQHFELLGMQIKATTTHIDNHGLPVQETTFESHEDPSKTLSLKLWIERSEVGLHANHTPSASSSPPSISKSVYAVRLWKLLDAVADEDSDEDKDTDEVEEDNNDTEHEVDSKIRAFHPLPLICTEIHTSLDAANRAAKRVQIYLSHEKVPTQPLQKQWQLTNLQELNRKVEDLRKEIDDGEGGEENGLPSLFEYEQGRRRGCWRSVFKGSGGPGDDSYEVLVCRVELSGPRNL